MRLPDAHGVSVHTDLPREEKLPVSFSHAHRKSAHNPAVCTGSPVLFIRGTKGHKQFLEHPLCHLWSGISNILSRSKEANLWGEMSQHYPRTSKTWDEAVFWVWVARYFYPLVRRSEQESFLQMVDESFGSGLPRDDRKAFSFVMFISLPKWPPYH